MVGSYLKGMKSLMFPVYILSSCHLLSLCPSCPSCHLCPLVSPHVLTLPVVTSCPMGPPVVSVCDGVDRARTDEAAQKQSARGCGARPSRGTRALRESVTHDNNHTTTPSKTVHLFNATRLGMERATRVEDGCPDLGARGDFGYYKRLLEVANQRRSGSADVVRLKLMC
ncbi:unnamed protein product [Boreogadus saida]